MAAPNTPVLSSFTGSDENPLSEGGNWGGVPVGGVTFQGDLRRVGNQAGPSSDPILQQSAFWSAPFAADQEVYATLVATLNATEIIAVWARVNNAGTTTPTGYLVLYQQGTGWQTYKCDEWAFTQLGATVASPAMVGGDKLALTCSGTTLEAWHFTSSWAQIMSRTDPDFTTGGVIALELDDEVSAGTMRADEFGGGTTPVAGGLAWVRA